MGQQQDNFMGGFLIGTIIGGVLGGVTGVLASSRLANREMGGSGDGERSRSVGQGSGRSMESTRRSLEDKIAQLNEAIDDVRQQLSSVEEPHRDNGDQAIANDSP